jgi:hypothetical protein
VASRGIERARRMNMLRVSPMNNWGIGQTPNAVRFRSAATDWGAVLISTFWYDVRMHRTSLVGKTVEVFTIAVSHCLYPSIMSCASSKILFAICILHAVEVGDICEVSVCLEGISNVSYLPKDSTARRDWPAGTLTSTPGMSWWEHLFSLLYQESHITPMVTADELALVGASGPASPQYRIGTRGHCRGRAGPPQN